MAGFAALLLWAGSPGTERQDPPSVFSQPVPGPSAAPPPGVAAAAAAPRLRARNLVRSAALGLPTSPGIAAGAHAPDPLIALVRVVRAIPDEAWQRAVEPRSTGVVAPPVRSEPIAIAPIEVPAIAEPPTEASAPGEL